MDNLLTPRSHSTFCRYGLLIALLLPFAALADTWQIQVGAQNGDRAHQALAFLPNEIWIHAGDSITWSFPSHEVHTVTFLALGQVRPNRFTGCAGGLPPDGRTPDFSGGFNGSTQHHLEVHLQAAQQLKSVASLQTEHCPGQV